MFDFHALLQTATLILVGIGGYLLTLMKERMLAAVKANAEELEKARVRDAHFAAELAQELQKTRGIERQGLRYKSYGALWKELRPLAIYDETAINAETVRDLFKQLTTWYFSECGGLLLTPQTRDFYFALQDLLRTTSQLPGNWETDRSGAADGDEQKTILRAVLAELDKGGGAVSVLDYFDTGAPGNWEAQAPILAKKWKDGIKHVAAKWSELGKTQRFAVLQQVGSILRTSLTIDLDSRLR